MAWAWLLGIACWTLACSALLAAFSTFDLAWGALLLGGAGVTLGWLGMAAVLSLRRRWSRRFLLCWAAWPAAVGVVALLHATDLPLTLRVAASRGALSEFVEEVRASARTRGRAGLVWVFDARTRDGCVFLRTGVAFDGMTGLVHAPGGSEPVGHADASLADLRHLTGPWWYFRTHT
jgi:hypothetical protein